MKQLYRTNGNLSCKYCTFLPYTLSLLFFLLFTIIGHTQTIKNAYAKVNSIATVGGKSQLTISNESLNGYTWAVNKEVIVIQMQDNVLGNTTNSSLFGGLLTGNNIGNAGAFEVATVTAVGTSPKTITLDRALTRPFNTGSNASVQVVSFTSLSTGNITTDDDITAIPWDGNLGRGGIVAISVGGTLTLRHEINVDGKGFAGGASSANKDPNCNDDNYFSNSTNYGAKGEGIYLNTDNNYTRGRARLLSGGGGGNSDGAGGAGGSNFSAGGNGALDGCSDGGGLGGVALGFSLLTGNRAFLGGGGGGGQGRSSQSDGGNGGGIILIRAGGLKTSCGSPGISANGKAAVGSGSYGAGGGGAAGTIILQIKSYNVLSACRLDIDANGGRGGSSGNILSSGGAGGGGGQGAILVTGSALMSNISQSTKPGAGGSKCLFCGSAPGGAGNDGDGEQGGIGVVLPVRLLFFNAESKNDKAVLSWSSADELNVTYTVERSTDGINFTSIGTVTGTGQPNYTFTDPNAITGTVYYRLVMSGDMNAQIIYSSVKHVSRTSATQVAAAYPNPAHDYFYIRVTGDNNNKQHKVTVTDLAGQVVYTTTGIPANNIIKVTPGRVLKPGLYMFRVTSDGYEQAGKLMIQ
ncbi:hypothetical protein A4H97_08895 [Niastella yeongjuensis]|uniref:Secretion system C-terminal sorting domain-containing protein n=1 Tax=Niastella yeongjuensis TaxID=354355 RepID=A0A1V9EED1_9BACT|nr:T9SS type A sorting domain-containing protein [Niastella yeongjuensis]OQP44483.1 hypothetical protein A4H97_08895 [Niastella yeongjuensis]SEO86065.1 Por secretion system C-terminal sorting domain-containing protein [Niastella yeongjuensis]